MHTVRLVNIVSWLWAEQLRNCGSIPGWGQEISLLPSIHTSSGTNSAPYSVGTEGLSLRTRQPRRETDYSPPYSAKVRNEWSYKCSPHMASWHAQVQLYIYFTLFSEIFNLHIVGCTNCVKKNPWEAAMSYLTNSLPHWKPNVHYYICKSLFLAPIVDTL